MSFIFWPHEPNTDFTFVAMETPWNALAATQAHTCPMDMDDMLQTALTQTESMPPPPPGLVPTALFSAPQARPTALRASRKPQKKHRVSIKAHSYNRRERVRERLKEDRWAARVERTLHPENPMVKIDADIEASRQFCSAMDPEGDPMQDMLFYDVVSTARSAQSGTQEIAPHVDSMISTLDRILVGALDPATNMIGEGRRVAMILSVLVSLSSMDPVAFVRRIEGRPLPPRFTWESKTLIAPPLNADPAATFLRRMDCLLAKTFDAHPAVRRNIAECIFDIYSLIVCDFYSAHAFTEAQKLAIERESFIFRSMADTALRAIMVTLKYAMRMDPSGLASECISPNLFTAIDTAQCIIANANVAAHNAACFTDELIALCIPQKQKDPIAIFRRTEIFVTLAGQIPPALLKCMDRLRTGNAWETSGKPVLDALIRLLEASLLFAINHIGQAMCVDIVGSVLVAMAHAGRALASAADKHRDLGCIVAPLWNSVHTGLNVLTRLPEFRGNSSQLVVVINGLTRIMAEGTFDIEGTAPMQNQCVEIIAGLLNLESFRDGIRVNQLVFDLFFKDFVVCVSKSAVLTNMVSSLRGTGFAIESFAIARELFPDNSLLGRMIDYLNLEATPHATPATLPMAAAVDQRTFGVDMQEATEEPMD